MKSYPYVPSMVQAITVLTVLKMMTKGQYQTAPWSHPSLNPGIFQRKLPAVRAR